MDLHRNLLTKRLAMAVTNRKQSDVPNMIFPAPMKTTLKSFPVMGAVLERDQLPNAPVAFKLTCPHDENQIHAQSLWELE